MKQITVKSVAYVSPLCVQITYSDGFTNVVNIGDFIKQNSKEEAKPAVAEEKPAEEEKKAEPDPDAPIDLENRD